MCGRSVAPCEELCDRCRIQPPAGGLERHGKRLLIAGAAGLVLVCAAVAVFITVRRKLRAAAEERKAAANLRTIAAAQESFRKEDLDFDGRSNYWIDDVAGLYAMLRMDKVREVRRRGVRFGDECRMDLIPDYLALADQNPFRTTPMPDSYPEAATVLGRPGPAGGYWFRSLTEGTEREAGFAVAAIPDRHGEYGRNVLFIDESGSVRARDFGEPILDRTGAPPALRSGFLDARPAGDELSRWGPFP